MRSTRQKEMLTSLLFEKARHVTAEELFKEVNREKKEMSQATIYRHLEQLHKEGKLNRYYNGSSYVYDSNTRRHDHMFCERCGKLFDVHLPKEDLIEVANQTSSHRILDRHIIFKGVCNNCLKKEKTRWN